MISNCGSKALLFVKYNQDEDLVLPTPDENTLMKVGDPEFTG
jgi:hypothetical protein